MPPTEVTMQISPSSSFPAALFAKTRGTAFPFHPRALDRSAFRAIPSKGDLFPAARLSPRGRHLGWARPEGGEGRARLTPRSTEAGVDFLARSTSEQTSQLTISTRDGDTITLSLLRASEQNEAFSIRHEEASTGGKRPSASPRLAMTELAHAEAEGTLLEHLKSIDDGRAEETLTGATVSGERSEGFLGAAREGERAGVQYLSESWASTGFRISVEGSLDDEERAAIDQLVGQVDRLAQNFFEGDVFAAISQGKALEYDESEIASFSLQLEKTETQSVALRYHEMASVGERRPLPAGIARQVGPYLGQMEEVAKRGAERFQPEEVGRLIATLTEWRYLFAESSAIGGDPQGAGALNARLFDWIAGLSEERS